MSRIVCTIQKSARAVTRAAMLLIVAGGAMACAPNWPQTGFKPTAAARAAPEPTLLTGPEMLAAVGPGGNPQAVEQAEELAARAGALRARGTALSGPVLTPGARAKLDDAAACAPAKATAANANDGSPTERQLCINR